MISIRRFLLLSVILALVLVTTVASIWHYRSVSSEIKQMFDTQLIETAHTLNILLTSDLRTKHLAEIQNNLDAYTKQLQAARDQNLTSGDPLSIALRQRFEIRHIFQIWDRNGKLLIHSTFAPDVPVDPTFRIGLHDFVIAGNGWHSYTLLDTTHDLIIQIAQQSDIRATLEHDFARAQLKPILFMLPLLAILLWLAIGHALKLLQKIANEIRNRDPANLQPVALTHIPSEIQPIIIELNRLFTALSSEFARSRRFNADAAHELRTPLAALKIQAQVALRYTHDLNNQAEVQQLTKNIIQCIDRCSHVVNQLLILSKLDPHQGLQDVTQCNLVTIAKQLLTELAIFALEKDIEISLNVEQNAQHAMILGNETAIGILIRNLIDNAIRYTPAYGTVAVTIAASPTSVQFIVTDSGPGIAPEDRERVFERFYRKDQTVLGSGLGLSIVQQIIELHHATIKLETPPNQVGLRIIVEFTLSL